MRTILFCCPNSRNGGAGILNKSNDLASAGNTHSSHQRDVYLDNVKGFLIACVVFGHMAIPVSERTNSLACIYKTIYLFHMPLFVFVSGYLSKSITKKGLRVDKICSMLVLAFLYRVLLQASDSHLTLEFFTKYVFYFGGAPWYLLSLATWYMLVPYFEKLRPLVAISLSIMLALCAGAYSQIGQVLSLSRTLVFLPYFLTGFYCSKKTLEKIRSCTILKVLSLGLALLLVLYLFHTKYAVFQDSYYLVYADSSYRNGIRNGVFFRTLFAILACIISTCIVCYAPSKSLPILTRLGENTFQIYMIHRLMRAFVVALGIYDMHAMSVEFLAPTIILLVSVVITAICMLPVFNKPFRWLMSESGKLFTRPQSSDN